MSGTTILRGQVLGFARSPFDGDPEGAARVDEAVAIAGGRILATGSAEALEAAKKCFAEQRS